MGRRIHPRHRAILQELVAELDEAGPRSPNGGERRVGELAIERYLSGARFERERAEIFERLPVVVAHASEVRAPGACLPVMVGRVPVIIVRDTDGTLRAHRNACRHRATQLVTEPCRKKAIVCPYHGWTYDLGGALIHVPHEVTFLHRAGERAALGRAYVEERQGLVWAALAPFDGGAHVGMLDDELESLDMQRGVLYRKRAREVRANWKLIVDLFVESYHLRHLHRDSVYRFFHDARSRADKVGPHIRALTPRRALSKASAAQLDDLDVRAVTSPSYVLFPNAILIFHPDYESVLTLEPSAADRTILTHHMSIARPPSSAAEEEHFDKSFALIDGTLFDQEDLAIAERMQVGLSARADQTILVGDLEQPMLWFHESVDQALLGGVELASDAAARVLVPAGVGVTADPRADLEHGEHAAHLDRPERPGAGHHR